MDQQDDEDCESAVDYIGEMTLELAKMAKAAHCDKLALILDLAALEAAQISRGQMTDRPASSPRAGLQ